MDDIKKSFWEHFHFGKVVVRYGVSWKIIRFFKASIPLCCRYVFYSSWYKIASGSVLQAAVTTFAFSSVFILLLWENPSLFQGNRLPDVTRII